MANQIKSLTGEKPIIGWNWGACFFCLIWGIANKCYWSVLTLIPGASLIVSIVFGLFGSKWVYDNGAYESVEAFNGAMQSWNRAGIAYAILLAVLLSCSTIIIIICGLIGVSIFEIVDVISK